MRRAEDAAIPRIASLARTADLDVEIVGYERPQHQFIESDYSESCKGFEMRPFDMFLEARLDHGRYDYSKCFRPWREAFGHRLVVYPLVGWFQGAWSSARARSARAASSATPAATTCSR